MKRCPLSVYPTAALSVIVSVAGGVAVKKMIPVPQFGGSVGDFVAWIFGDVMGQATQSI